MPLLVDAEHFLDLRLGLQREVLRAAAAEDHDRALARRRAWRRARSTPSRSRRRSGRSRTCSRRARARRRSCRSTSRRATTCRSARRTCTPRRAATSARCPARARARARTCRTASGTRRSTSARWNSLPLDDLPEERVGREQHVVVEEDVVDADDAFFAQHDVRRLRVAAMHRRARARSACRGTDSRPSR